MTNNNLVIDKFYMVLVWYAKWEIVNAFLLMLLAFRDKRWAFVDNITAFPVIDFARRESFPARRGTSTALPDDMWE